jgi:hypothetical protein
MGLRNPYIQLTATKRNHMIQYNADHSSLWGPFTGIVAFIFVFLSFSCWALAGSGAVSAENVMLVGHLDIDGGGMVDVRGNLAAVGHMGPPYATSLLDVADPSRPRIVSRIKVRPGTHSHKARICDNTLVINVESYGGGGDGKAGLALYDITNPREPKEISFYTMGGQSTGGTGVHRFQLDCSRKLVYASGSSDGFQGNLTTIIDISDQAHPREIGRWWFPGQHLSGGERPTWRGSNFRTHHPLRMGNRLYVSLWFGGFAILDVTDITKPRLISHANYHQGDSSPTHTALPVGHRILDKDWLIVFDEELGSSDPPAFMRIFDVTDEGHPKQVGTFLVPKDPSGRTGGRFGSHQPHEHVGKDNLIYGAWFSGGLRVIDVSNPYIPREVGHYIPKPGKGERFAQSNDVFVDERGLVYLIDRNQGLDVLKFTGER